MPAASNLQLRRTVCLLSAGGVAACLGLLHIGRGPLVRRGATSASSGRPWAPRVRSQRLDCAPYRRQIIVGDVHGCLQLRWHNTFLFGFRVVVCFVFGTCIANEKVRR